MSLSQDPPPEAHQSPSGHSNESHRPNKRSKVDAESPGNARDLTLASRGGLPLLPKDCRILLTDVVGCTTSVSFVEEVLRPGMFRRIDAYLNSASEMKVISHLVRLERELRGVEDDDVRSEIDELPVPKEKSTASFSSLKAAVAGLAEIVLRRNVGCLGTLATESRKTVVEGEDALIVEVQDDVPAAFRWLAERGVSVCTIGNYGEVTEWDRNFSSVRAATDALGMDLAEVCYVSASEERLEAARRDGVGYAVACVRPGNDLMTSEEAAEGKGFPRIYSIMQLCGR